MSDNITSLRSDELKYMDDTVQDEYQSTVSKALGLRVSPKMISIAQ